MNDVMGYSQIGSGAVWRVHPQVGDKSADGGMRVLRCSRGATQGLEPAVSTELQIDGYPSTKTEERALKTAASRPWKNTI